MKNYFKILLITFMLSITIYSAAASNMSCVYADSPFLKEGLGDLTERNKIYWVCTLPNETDLNGNNETEFNCFTYVTYDGDLIQANPADKYVEKTGKIDSFQSHNGIVKVWYLNTDLRHNKTVLFTALCNSEDGSSYNLSANITPMFKDPYELIDRGSWTLKNAPYGVLIFFIILFLAIILGIIIKFVKDKKS